MAKIITSESEVPAGWLRIADITTNSTDAKILSDAHNSGDLPAVKLIRTTSEIRTGPVWVEPVAAKAILSQCQAKRDHAPPRPSGAGEHLEPWFDDLAVRRQTVAVLLRIADALERIAPPAAQ